nr:hypothetical protein [Actinomycetales bacterium]
FATDSLEIHERYGAVLVEQFNLPVFFGMRPQDTGELLVMAIAAAVTLPFVVVALKVAHRAERPWVLPVVVNSALIMFCGVVLDAVHSMITDVYAAGDPFGLIEDGGEMLFASLLVAFLFRVWLGHRHEPVPWAAASPQRAPDASASHHQ